MLLKLPGRKKNRSGTHADSFASGKVSQEQRSKRLANCSRFEEMQALQLVAAKQEEMQALQLVAAKQEAAVGRPCTARCFEGSIFKNR